MSGTKPDSLIAFSVPHSRDEPSFAFNFFGSSFLLKEPIFRFSFLQALIISGEYFIFITAFFVGSNFIAVKTILAICLDTPKLGLDTVIMSLPYLIILHGIAITSSNPFASERATAIFDWTSGINIPIFASFNFSITDSIS